MSADKHKGVGRREKLMAIAHRGRLYVNCKWQRQTHQDRDLRLLLKRGDLVLMREGGTGRKRSSKRQTYAAVP